MQMQVEAFLNSTLNPQTEFMELYYRYAKVKAEVNKMTEERDKAAAKASGRMSKA